MRLTEIEQALALRCGGKAQVWEYHISHQWLTLRLTKPGLAGNFHLRCGAYERIEFDTQWMVDNLQIEPDGDGFIVTDGVHFRVTCGIVEGRYNVPPLF